MRKIINLSALVCFVWLLLDAFQIPNILINFLLVGQIPGMNSSLSPNLMLAIMVTAAGTVVFEMLARRIEIVRRIRYHFVTIINQRERLPRRRFNRV